MRIGIDASCWPQPRGYGRFTRELLGALFEAAPDDEFLLYAGAAEAAVLPARSGRVRPRPVVLGAAPAEAASADGYRSPRDLLRMRKAVLADRPDVVFFPSVYTYFPLPKRIKSVVTIHDAIAERFPKLTLPSVRARLFWKLKVALAVRNARLVLTVSEFAARELQEVLRIERARLRVAVEAPSTIYRPVDDPAAIAAAAARAGIPAGIPWFSYVGGFNPHKNLDVLLRAHERLTRSRPAALVLAGPGQRDNFHRAGLDPGPRPANAPVLFPGFLEDDELRLLHAGARALVLPSQCEGFGLPAVEAAACGTPVIATTQSPLPELLSDGGIFIAPRDEDALVDAMRRLHEDDALRTRLGATALARARGLSWARAAAVTLAALREAAA